MDQEMERLNIKIANSDKLALQQLADLESEAVSVVVRRIIRAELKRRGLIFETFMPAESRMTIDTVKFQGMATE